VFDLFEGKNFELIITRQGEYNNYDKSKFSASTSPIIIEGEPAERSKEAMATIKAELDAAPSLANYDYQPWDEETRNFVNNVLRMYLNPGDAIAEVTSSAPKKAVKKEATSTPAPKATTAVEEATEATNTTSSVDSEDDLDSFLNDLDI
jgi:hypothetical protein